MGLTPATTLKLENILKNKMHDLVLQMALVVDVGAEIVKATYILEGDGADLACITYDFLVGVRDALMRDTWPNVRGVIRVGVQNGMRSAAQLQADMERLLEEAKGMMKGYLDFFDLKIGDLESPGKSGEMPELMTFYKMARLTNPFAVQGLALTEADVDALCNSIPCLAKHKNIRQGLKRELPTYKALAIEFSSKWEGDIKTNDRAKKFWVPNKKNLPTWFTVALLLATCIPSSGAVERVFNRLRRCFGHDNLAALADYIEASLMMQVSVQV
jgi:hypothetical protein